MKNTISLLNFGRLMCVIYKILLIIGCIAWLVMAIVLTILAGPIYLIYLIGIPVFVLFVLLINYFQHLYEGSISEFTKLDNYVSALHINIENTKEMINAIREKTVVHESTIDEPEQEVADQATENTKNRAEDNSSELIKLEDKIMLLNDITLNGKTFKKDSIGVVDNILVNSYGTTYVIILDNDPDKTEINLRREIIKKIK